MTEVPKRDGVTDRTLNRRDERAFNFTNVEIKNGCGSLLERGRLQDLSPDGARIHKATKRPLPRKMILFFPADGIRKIAEMKWQDGQLVGVEFEKPLALPDVLGDLQVHSSRASSVD